MSSEPNFDTANLIVLSISQRVADIRFEKLGRAATAADFVGDAIRPFIVQVDYDHSGAFGGESFSGCFSDA